nr:immunoglobulin superfamily DCC subclass member 3 [Tursiops truncatus]
MDLFIRLPQMGRQMEIEKDGGRKKGPPKLKSCLLTPRPGREGLKTEGRWWAPGGRRVQASLAVPAGRTAGSELAFLRELGDVVATRERPLVLPCRVEGELPVSISWQRDGLVLANDSSATLMPDGSLHLATPPSHWSLPSRAHKYHCVAQNRFGRLVSRRAWVQLASLSRFHQHPESVEVELGGVASSA